MCSAALVDPVNGRDPSGLFGLGGLLGGSLTGNDLNLNTADVGLTFLESLRGFAALVAQRNLELEQASGLAADGNIDAALDFIQAGQNFRTALLAGGALAAGAQFAKLGFAAGRALVGAFKRRGRFIYSVRVLRRGAASDPFHRFPETFDALVIRNGTVTIGNGNYVQFNCKRPVNPIFNQPGF